MTRSNSCATRLSIKKISPEKCDFIFLSRMSRIFSKWCGDPSPRSSQFFFSTRMLWSGREGMLLSPLYLPQEFMEFLSSFMSQIRCREKLIVGRDHSQRESHSRIRRHSAIFPPARRRLPDIPCDSRSERE